MKVKENKLGKLTALGFKKNTYPANSFILNNDIAIDADRDIVVLSKQGEVILTYMKSMRFVEG